MKQILSINRSGLGAAPVDPNPAIPGKYPQRPDVEELTGTAYMITSNGFLIDPTRPDGLENSQVWLFACTVVDGDPVICHVDAVYQVMNISSVFQLSSGRSGVTVQGSLYSKPGRAIIDVEPGRVLIFNVHVEDMQVMQQTSYLFRPAYDRLDTTGVYKSTWSYEIPTTEPDSFMSGYLKWTDDSGNQKRIATARAPKASSLTLMKTDNRGDLMNYLVWDEFVNPTYQAIAHFGQPYGLTLAGESANELVWIGLKKQAGYNMQAFVLYANAELRSYNNALLNAVNTALLFPTLYYTS